MFKNDILLYFKLLNFKVFILTEINILINYIFYIRELKILKCL